MRTVDIPGGTATFRESDDLRSKDSDLIEAAALAARSALQKLPPEVHEPVEGETSEEAMERIEGFMKDVDFTLAEAQAMVQLRRATVVATLASWTLVGADRRPRPLPTTVDMLGELPRDLVRSLDVAIGGMPVEAGTDLSATSDKRSPTTPSGASNGSLRADPTPTTPSTPPPPDAIDATSTARFTPV